MLKALVPIDSSSASERAVRHVIALAKDGEPLEVHPVDVQEKADALELRRFLTQTEIKRSQLEHGRAALAMGTHGRSGMTAPLMGAVATKILHLTSVPVTFVKK